MAISKEQMAGFIKHEEEVAADWHKAYTKAVEDDNADAIALLLRTAPKIKRVRDAAVRIKKNVDVYAQAERQLAIKPALTGDLDADLALASARGSAFRRMSGMHRFIEAVENL